MKKSYYFLCLVSMMISCAPLDGLVDVVEIGAGEPEVTLDCMSGTYVMDVFADGDWSASVTEGDWLFFTASSSSEMTGSGDAELDVSYQMNRGMDRTGKIVLKRGGRSFTVTLVQEGVISSSLYFENGNMLVGAEGGSSSAKFMTRLSDEDLQISISYDGAEGWISDVKKENNFLVFNVLANNLAEIRSAVITVSAVSDPSLQDILHVNQEGNQMVFTEIDFYTLKGLTASSAVIEDNLVLTGRVINDDSQGNGSEDLNISSTVKDSGRSSRVAYLQNDAADSGVLVEFETVEDNTTSRFDKIRLLLKGMTLTALGGDAEEPLRYELTGARAVNVLESESGSATDLPAKTRSIAELSDNDVYTYVTLTDCEIPIRKGPFVPVDIRYTDAMNKYPMPLRDKDGSTTYLMSNLDCSWARDGKGMPQGAGNVSGVIVHEKCDNFEWDNAEANRLMASGMALDYITGIGTISRYQIRPFTREEIGIAENFEDGFSDMVAEFAYFNRNYDDVVINVDESYTMFPTYPAVPSPVDDTSLKSRFIRWKDGAQEMFLTWRDWSHLGPLENGVITDPSGGNGVYDYYGRSAHWYVHSATATSGLIYDTNGAGWYCSQWTPEQYWLVSFSTEDLTVSNFPLSVNFGAENGLGETVGAPRHWVLEYSLDNSVWTEVSDYTVPDFTVIFQKRSWQCPGYKYFSINLPEDPSILGRETVYVRLRPDGSNAGSTDSYDGNAVVSTCQSAIDYFSIRYNK